MEKERPSFLENVSSDFNIIQDGFDRNELRLANERAEFERKRYLEEEDRRNRMEATKKEFLEIGVVGAFEEIIESKFLVISDKPVVEYQPTYNFFGKVNGEKRIVKADFVPAKIHYGANSIRLQVSSFWEDVSGSHNNSSYEEGYRYIGVEKKEEDVYKIGVYISNPRSGTEVKDFNGFINPVLVNKSNLMDSLSHLVAVYKHADLIEDSNPRAFYGYLPDAIKDNLPQFP